jgi:hypothetical protein
MKPLKPLIVGILLLGFVVSARAVADVLDVREKVIAKVLPFDLSQVKLLDGPF